jgi:hypothetical protein
MRPDLICYLLHISDLRILGGLTYLAHISDLVSGIAAAMPIHSMCMVTLARGSTNKPTPHDFTIQ